MGRWKWTAIFGVIAIIAYLVWQEFKLPSGFEPKGTNDEQIALIGFYTAIAGALAGFFSLLKEIIALIREGREE